ncbi:hypothetical protein TWF788_004218 [Orbilia oligospora]|uniref:F-box domain-containing protein n=1 Tax=Orbilia oligospora TaxID=2813651 RepID=A0A7C8Q570_ORBOL|nr:hypothetical protein TWF788_004218 [Orbilia oligospora]
MTLSLLSLADSPELFSNIIAYLHRTDTFSLLLTCKSLYPIAHQWLWSTLDLSEYPLFFNHEDSVSNQGRYKLAQLLKIYRSDLSGLKQIQNIHLNGGVFSKTSVTRTSGLMGTLGDQLYRRSIEPRHVSLDISSPTLHRDKFKHNLSDIFDLTKLTKINLTLYLRNRILSSDDQEALWDSSEEWEDNQPGNRSPQQRFADYDVIGDSDTGNIREQAKLLSGLLFSTPNLVHLCLATNSSRYEPVELYNFAKALKALQRTVLALRKLRVIELHGLIFHPCFFLHPPESVRVFRIESGGTGNVSAAWWKKFAACPFTNVEEMTLNTQHMALGNWTSSDDEEEQQNDIKFWIFGVGDVKMGNLRKFRAPLLETLQISHGPLDLLECVLKKNPQLDEDSVKRLSAACMLDKAYKMETADLMDENVYCDENQVC